VTQGIGSFPPSIIPLYRFSNLKELFLTITIRSSVGLDDHVFPVFVEALEVFSRTGTETGLTTIHVRYNGCSTYIERDVNHLVDRQRWKWLDETLQRPAFSRLKDVMIRFDIACCEGGIWGKGWDEYSGRVLSQLSSLVQRGIVTMTRSY
jgi:hypothetical protein